MYDVGLASGGKNVPEESSRFNRPWGAFFILDDQTHTKVKRLVVNPGHRLSLQSHKHRDEHWVVVKGTATVTVDDDTRDFSYGQHVFIKRGQKHRLACMGTEPVEIIEVQTGDQFPEEDIVRYSDDYERAGS
jgi:mannose-6-phosphate isomerase-like protein (cupin superfamily)